jgi:hypothetical protein
MEKTLTILKRIRVWRGDEEEATELKMRQDTLLTVVFHGAPLCQDSSSEAAVFINGVDPFGEDRRDRPRFQFIHQRCQGSPN